MTVDPPSDPQWPATSTALVRGTKVDIIPLLVVNLKSLLERDQDEARKLYEAAQSPGFLWLDLKDTKKYAADWRAMYAMTEKYFHQPEESKMRDYIEDEEFRGYKPWELGGTLEFLHDEFAQKTVVLPEILQEDAALLERFDLESHDIAYAMISSLSDSLCLDNQSRIEKQHPFNEPSYSSVKMEAFLSVEKMAGHPDTTHTDGGLLTMNSMEHWGFQIQLPWNKQWASVEPKSGYILVNVANTLQSLTGNKLHSCTHRFTQVGDGVENRVLVAYFLRPVLGTAC